jgi:hypothetical protein
MLLQNSNYLLTLPKWAEEDLFNQFFCVAVVALQEDERMIAAPELA